MKLDELEKMAQQTAAYGVHPSGEYIYSFYTEQLQAFAKLVSDKVYADYLEAPEPRQSGKLSITFETSPDLELIYQANSADIEALEDARFTLSAIQKTDSAYDEMINESIRLIDKALNINFIPVVERLFNITEPQ